MDGDRIRIYHASTDPANLRIANRKGRLQSIERSNHMSAPDEFPTMPGGGGGGGPSSRTYLAPRIVDTAGVCVLFVIY